VPSEQILFICTPNASEIIFYSQDLLKYCTITTANSCPNTKPKVQQPHVTPKGFVYRSNALTRRDANNGFGPILCKNEKQY
jgi:hypothetical protein